MKVVKEAALISDSLMRTHTQCAHYYYVYGAVINTEQSAVFLCRMHNRSI